MRTAPSLAATGLILSLLPGLTGVARAQTPSMVDDVLRRQLCSYDPLLAQAGADKARLENLYLMMLGVVTELGEHRRAFLEKAELIDLFPTAYYHTTVSEMGDIARADFAHPEVKLQQLLAFYDAYAENRALQNVGSPLVEPHWRDHFNTRGGSTLSTLFGADLFRIKSTLQSGVTAHVDYDLGRAIRDTFEGRNDRSLTASGLFPDFEKTNRVFAATVLRTNQDIVFALSDSRPEAELADVAGFLTLQAGSLLSARDVRQRRQEAWQEAFSNQPLTGMDGGALASQVRRQREIYLEKGKRFCDGIQGPATLFLFDTSGSMAERNKIEQARASGLQTLETIRRSGNRSGDPQVSLLAFSGECRPASTRTFLPFTTDLVRAGTTMRTGLPAPGGATPLPQAIEVAEKTLADFARANPKIPELTLVVLSDGESTCGPIRPRGTYSAASPGSGKASLQGRPAGSPEIRYHAVGFDLQPGSAAERDLQYLASAHGGRYFNALDQGQLTRAFQRFVRVYDPKPYPTTEALPIDPALTFARGVLAILGRDFAGARTSFGSYLQSYGQDAAGHFNLALALEATDRYRGAGEHYERYAALAPAAPDSAEARDHARRMREDYGDHFAYQVQLLRSDLDYLKSYYQSLFNRSNAELAAEFASFLREKGDFYANLPAVLEFDKPWLKTSTKDLVRGFKRIAERIDEPTFDRDAVSLLAVPIAQLEEILERLGQAAL